MTNNINEKELENVTGGWQYANGSFVNYGNYIVYTVAPGDVLSGIGQRAITSSTRWHPAMSSAALVSASVSAICRLLSGTTSRIPT